ncbi:NAD(P)/FAD-dependent oxidoreductase [Deminuibacter soli]|uniref:Amine oxidase domain-containing protein n=1 Tax=Deminuibacter soli TaxID=2291815 RepID=A0A3E1NIY4_9BACT|nr:NAD(P)/FAD-dependent oxidoreductase [Deminuibacter soli]RFM27841.1 hypothetical protein DXN05_14195 [Deminuibacter soli]
MGQKAIIIGAGPAGLTAAYELLKRTDITPIILEKSGDIGGISKTVNYKGNRMDIGGHRFFSKSDRVMNWWINILPIQNDESGIFTISYQNQHRDLHLNDTSAAGDRVMLVRKRLSRIYFLRRFFGYPIQLSIETLRKLGLARTIAILFSYMQAQLFPKKPENSLEDFFINRFGKTLYQLFFKDYTEKVWGVSCKEISAEWGAQRIKGVSISKAIAHAIKSLKPSGKTNTGDIKQKGVETSLIERFLYPKLGPGQLWEEVARQVQEMGGIIHMHQEVNEIITSNNEVTAITARDAKTGELTAFEGDYFFSTMPVKELIAGMNGQVPADINRVAAGLQYRDFITVGILLKRLSSTDLKTGQSTTLDLQDTWIYIQESDVKVGRLQLFNNWSPYMVKDPDTVWVGMEFFCNTEDAFWKMKDEDIQQLAISELAKIGLAQKEDVLDSNILRVEKTYPAYFGTYDEFDKIRAYTDQFSNLFLVGRNGMHKYNNADHSMLTAMVSVDNIAAGITDKANIWSINTEQEYHEEKGQEAVGSTPSILPAPKTGSLAAFAGFIWNNKWNRGYLVTAILAFILQFWLFKLQYPFANYMPDSYSYLQAAASNWDVNMWPVGYSKFLRLVSVFTHSDTGVTGLQYGMLGCSLLLFFYTLLYFFNPGKVVKNILFLFFVLNPISLYISNYISSDTLFISLSLLWFTQLIWIIYRPTAVQLVVQAFLLLACFVVRYNAIYYPIIAAAAFILSHQGWQRKVTGIALGCLFIFASISYTSNKMQQETGKRQFSAFGGWQLANNALYMYERVPKSERTPVPVRFAKLDGMVRAYIDTLGRMKMNGLDSSQYASYMFYLWSSKSPLQQYVVKNTGKDSAETFKNWAATAPLFSDYATYLIKQHPVAYLKNFMTPNAIRYAAPPAEFIARYNMGSDSVKNLAKIWFQYKTQKVSNQNGKARTIGAPTTYAVFSSITNALLLISIAGMLIFKGYKENRNGVKRLLNLTLLLWIMNVGFSIVASPIVLRYQCLPLLITFSVALITAEIVFNLSKEQENKASASSQGLLPA